MVLPPILEIGTLHFDHESCRSCGRACSPEVNRLRFRVEAHSPRGVAKAFTPIYVLMVDEKLFVEYPYSVNRLTPAHEETARQRLHIPGRLMIEVAHEPVAEIA